MSPMTGPRSHRNRFVRCLVCDRDVTYNNLSAHMKNRHPERYGEPRSTLYAEIEGQPQPAMALAVPESTATELPPLGPEDLDAITLSVVGQLAEPAGTIPVRLLPAIFAWREATAIFLRSVSER